MDRNLKVERLRKCLGRFATDGGLERLADDPAALESIAPPLEETVDEDRERGARNAVERFARFEDVDDDDIGFAEAIILPRGRPVIDIQHDRYQAPTGLWAGLGLEPARTAVEAGIPSVGRVELPNHPQIPYGGTGFVVGRNLLMTNRHVAEIFTSGLGIRGLSFRPGQSAALDFKKENDVPDEVLVNVREVVMVHPFWDMALLRVDGLPAGQRVLSLSTEHPDDLRGRRVAVLGYPAMDSRNDLDLQLRIFRSVFNVKRLQPGEITGRRRIRSFENVVNALTHDASTLGGNSGSAVLDIESGRIVGLHFAGVYLDSNFAVPTHELARDARVVDCGIHFDGNVAVGTLPWKARWDVADPAAGSKETSPAAPHLQIPADAVSRQATRWTIPLEVTVSIGNAVIAQADDTAVAAADTEAPPTTPDPDYSSREGYDQDFLGEGQRVRIPWLSNEQFADVSFNSQASSQRHVLPYNHFSVVMSASRRIAYYTAVNIDGTREDEVTRKQFRDTWVLDPRIPAEAQLDNEFYRRHQGIDNPLDRGHLVRRLDPCWGANRAEVIAAHHDTFHWTNSSPQHARFNQSTNRWLGVEQHILKNANVQDLKVTVFSGPVLREDDPVYTTPTGLQVQLPTEYWKVVVFVGSSGRRSASGYLLSQQVEVDAMTEAFDFGDFNNTQVTIEEIEQVTGLTFRDTHGFDPLADGSEAPGPRGRPSIALTSYDVLRL